MRSLGYTVVQDPVAFDLITRQSLLFVPHLGFGLFARALETVNPVVCIGSDLDGFVDW